MAAAQLKKPELGCVFDHEHNTGQVTELSLLLYRGGTVSAGLEDVLSGWGCCSPP